MNLNPNASFELITEKKELRHGGLAAEEKRKKYPTATRFTALKGLTRLGACHGCSQRAG